MVPSIESSLRVGLVGTGVELVKAIEALRDAPRTEIVIVVDARERSEGATLAKRLRLPVITNAAEVFRSRANVVLEVSGDERRYGRLLALRPPGVEVLGTRGARLLIELLGRPAAEAMDAIADGVTPVTAAKLQAVPPRSRVLEDVAKALLPPLSAAAGMDLAALAVPTASGFSWILPSPNAEPLTATPPHHLDDALARGDPLWLVQPAPRLSVLGLLPLRAGQTAVGVLALARGKGGAASPDEIERLRFGVALLVAALQAIAPGEVEVSRAVPCDEPVSGETPARSATRPSADRPGILLVDADPTVRSAVEEVLRARGYAVTCTASGSEGITEVRRRQGAFDVVITDLAMPDVAGWDVVLTVNRLAPHTRVIILSGFDRARTMRRAKAFGVDAVIWKPVDPQELLAALQDLVDERVPGAL